MIGLDEDELVTELVDFCCGDCNGSDWTLKIGHRSDGEIFLIISCANQSCLDKKRRDLGAEPGALLVWQEYRITDEYDKTEEDEMPTEVN